MKVLRPLGLLAALAMLPGCVVAGSSGYDSYGYGHGYSQPYYSQSYYSPRYYTPAPVYRPRYVSPPVVVERPRYVPVPAYRPPPVVHRGGWDGRHDGGRGRGEYRREPRASDPGPFRRGSDGGFRWRDPRQEQ